MAAFVSTRPCCEPGQPVHPRPLGCWRRGCHMDGSGTRAPSMSSTGLSLCARGGRALPPPVSASVLGRALHPRGLSTELAASVSWAAVGEGDGHPSWMTVPCALTRISRSL